MSNDFWNHANSLIALRNSKLALRTYFCNRATGEFLAVDVSLFWRRKLLSHFLGSSKSFSVSGMVKREFSAVRKGVMAGVLKLSDKLVSSEPPHALRESATLQRIQSTEVLDLIKPSNYRPAQLPQRELTSSGLA